MNKNFAKIPENAESKAVDREKEEYPVQQVAVTRSCDLPEGSPIIPVAPPTNANGL